MIHLKREYPWLSKKRRWVLANAFVLVAIALVVSTLGIEFSSLSPKTTYWYYPRPRVEILMFSTSNILEKYARATAKVNEHYALRHGYAFKHVVDTNADEISRENIMWKRVQLIKESLHDADVIFYIDSDAVINNQTRSLDWLMEGDGDIIACSDEGNGPSVANAGVMFVRNTPMSEQLLEEWWSLRNDPEYADFPYEQKAFGTVALKHPDSIKIHPSEEFNSIWWSLKQGNRDTFVLHFMAYDDCDRAIEIDKILTRLNITRDDLDSKYLSDCSATRLEGENKRFLL